MIPAGIWSYDVADQSLPPGCSWSLAILLPSHSALHTDTALIEFLDVRQGDAILVTTPEEKTMLADAGPSGKIVEKLQRRGLSSIDLMVISQQFPARCL